MADLPAGTLTFLFSDIEGSTRLLRELRDRYAQVLADHRTLMRRAFAEFGGEEMGTEGDAFFFAFRRARDAIGAAASGQRAIAAHRWPDGLEVRIRMGLNTGEPSIEEEGYFGLGLHLTARICSAAYGGQVLVSQSTASLCRDEELSGVEFRDMGEHMLKDFDRPERLFQLVIGGLRDEFPPPRTLDKQTAGDTAFRGEVGAPYKGLEAFQPQDAEFFFGREELIEDLAGRLAGGAFLAVVGPSGSGKSSVVRAGLVPAVWAGAHGLAPHRDWKIVILTPGAHPLEEVAVRLATERGLSPGSVLDDLKRDPHNLCLAVRQLLLDSSPDAKVVLIVDQAEEIFTLCRDEEERRTFIELLAHAAEEKAQTIVILSLRADFYGHCASYPVLASLLQDHQSLVGPMREGEIRRAIELPAARAGLRIEDGLVTRILDDVGNEPGSLPLLSHALLETWSRRQNGTMTLAAYIESGGVRGAIARTADAVYEQLEPEQKEVARRIFLRLTEPGRGTEDTRRRASLGELFPGGDEQEAVEDVLDILARARLVTVGQDAAEVSHEALIREWPLLRRWLDEDREGLQIHRRLTDDASEWERFGRDPELLYRGARLSAAEEWAGVQKPTGKEWAGGHRPSLSKTEREFLEASRAARERELERTRRRQRRLMGVAATLAVLLGLAVIAAVFALDQRGRAQREERSASARALVQGAQAELAERRLDRALLLGLEAERTRATPQGRSVLLASLQHAGRVLQFLRGHEGRVSDVAFSRDGKLLATIGADGTIRLWDATTRRPVSEALVPPGKASGIAVAFGRGGRLASSDSDGVVRIWDVASRSQTVALRRADGVVDLDFSADGRLLAVAGGDVVLLWDVAAGRQVGSPLAPDRAPTSVAFSPDSRRLAAGGVSAISVWDLRTRAETRYDTPSAESIAFSPDGATLAAAGGVGSPVDIWNLRRPPSTPRRLRVGAGALAVAFSPDGTWIAAGGSGGVVTLVRVGTLRPLPVPLVGHTAGVTALAFSGDGRTLATASDDGSAILWDARRDPRSASLLGPGPPAVAVAAAGRTVAAARGSDAFVWNLGDERSRPRRIDGGALLLDVDLSTDGRRLAGGTQEGTAFLVDLPRGGVRTLQPGDPNTADVVVDVALSPDGSAFAASLQNGAVLLEQATATQLARPLPNDAEPSIALDLAFSPDGGELAAGRVGGTIVLWDTRKRRLSRKLFRVHQTDVRAVDFSPDGELIASTGGESAATLRSVSEGSEAGEPMRASRPLTAMRFSPDGRLLVAGTTTGEVVIFDVESREPLGEPLITHTRSVYGVAFADNGRRVVSAGGDGRVLLWNVEPWANEGVLRERACSVVGRNLTRTEWEQFLPGKSYRRTCDEWPAAD